jgi:putative ABC transport system permease protein
LIGVFGMLAYSVQQRMRDFGVRRALGASSGDVLRLVAGNAMQVVAAGGILGLALSAMLARLLATILFGVEPLDPTTFLAVPILLILTAAVSIAGPAWRATRIDPAVALRIE